MLYLNYPSIDQLKAANQLAAYVSGICSDRAGAFDRVLVLLFPVGRRNRFYLSPRVTLYEFDLPEVRLLGRVGFGWLGRILRWFAAITYALVLSRRHRVSYVEATEPYLRGLSAFLLSRLLRVPYGVQGSANFDLIYQSTGSAPGAPTFRWRSIAKLVERFVLRHADALVVDRSLYARYMVANGGRPDRLVGGRVIVHPLYYGDPCPDSALTSALGLAGRRLLIYVGRLSSEKHVLGLVRCLAEVRGRGHAAALVMAGEGPLREQLSALAESSGVGDAVRLIGTLPVAALARLVASADVSLAPYSGLSLVEAALCANAIVAYDWEWHREVVRDGETGLLVPALDWYAMANAVDRLLRDDLLRRALGSNARAFALAHHSPQAVLAAYRDQLLRHLP